MQIRIIAVRKTGSVPVDELHAVQDMVTKQAIQEQERVTLVFDCPCTKFTAGTVMTDGKAE